MRGDGKGGGTQLYGGQKNDRGMASSRREKGLEPEWTRLRGNGMWQRSGVAQARKWGSPGARVTGKGVEIGGGLIGMSQSGLYQGKTG